MTSSLSLAWRDKDTLPLLFLVREAVRRQKRCDSAPSAGRGRAGTALSSSGVLLFVYVLMFTVFFLGVKIMIEGRIFVISC